MTPLGWFFGFAAVSTAACLGLLFGCVLAANRVYEAQEDARAAQQKLSAYRAQVENPPAPFEYDTRRN
jgi:hypothetical protein